MTKTLIIAEIGVNHNGKLEYAKQLIDEAVKARADFVKFQTYVTDELVVSDAPKAKYQLNYGPKNQKQNEMLVTLELNQASHSILFEYCKKKNIGFMSSAFDIESLNFLLSLGVDVFKVPSGEITNVPYLRHLGSFGKLIILSTGMSNMHEIKTALDTLESAGTPREKISVLHCNTGYPTPFEDVNLLAMNEIKQKFAVDTGYSDHTEGIEIAVAAVALGASIIEKHLTLDRSLDGPDHFASLEPSEFQNMVKGIRHIEEALGNGVKRLMPSEKDNVFAVRKSIVAKNDISKGDILSIGNITTKRPGTGISPSRWDEVLGKRASRDFIKDELIEL